MDNRITAVKFHGIKISHVLVNEKWIQLGDAESSTDYINFGSKFIHMVGVSVNPGSVEYLFKLGNPIDATIEDLRKTIEIAPSDMQVDDMHEALRIIQKNYLHRDFYTLTFNRNAPIEQPALSLMPLMYWLIVIILLIVVGIILADLQHARPVAFDWQGLLNSSRLSEREAS